MAVETTGHSVDVLDFLFNHNDDLLTPHSGCNLEENGLQLPDSVLVR